MPEARGRGSNPLSPSAWRQLAEWLAQADIDCLELDGPGLRLRMVRGADGYRIENGPAAASTPAAAPAAATAAVAPCAGFFLDTHLAQGALLARRGDRVRTGDLVALLQVGLLLVPVVAPMAGVVGDTLATPGSLMGYGSRLVEIVAGDT